MTKKNAILFSAIFAVLYSIAYAVIGPMIKSQDIRFQSSFIVPCIICFVICLIVNFLVFYFVPRIRFGKLNDKLTKRIDKVKNYKLFLILWAIIFVCWIPAYLILYPGVLSYDILSQTLSAMGTITSNHHPVLHTFTIRVFMNLGESVFGGYEYGIGLLSLMQMLLLSYSLTRMVMLIKSKKVPILIVILVAILSACWFMNAVLSMTMIKDVLHAAFLVLFACHYTEIVMNPKEYVKKKRNLILFPIVVFFMCAYRNNGFHIFLFCLGILALIRIPKIKKIKTYIPLIIVTILAGVAFKIYSGPVFKALNIEQGEVREALSIPIQQLQRVAVLHGGELTEEQNDKMLYYITDLSWRDWDPGRKYHPFISDPAKSCFSSAAYNEDPAAFWKYYLEIGNQFTKEYIIAALSNTAGFWYPGYYEFSYVEFHNYPSEQFVVPLERKSIVDSGVLNKGYESLCLGEFWRKTPGIRFFFVSGFVSWILLYALVLSWKKKGFFTKVFPLFLPLIGQFGIMLLSPMSSFRYSWPFYLLLPVTLIGIFVKENKAEEAKEENTETEVTGQEALIQEGE